jgi:hypothetical protein
MPGYNNNYSYNSDGGGVQVINLSRHSNYTNPQSQDVVFLQNGQKINFRVPLLPKSRLYHIKRPHTLMVNGQTQKSSNLNLTYDQTKQPYIVGQDIQGQGVIVRNPNFTSNTRVENKKKEKTEKKGYYKLYRITRPYALDHPPRNSIDMIKLGNNQQTKRGQATAANSVALSQNNHQNTNQVQIINHTNDGSKVVDGNYKQYGNNMIISTQSFPNQPQTYFVVVPPQPAPVIYVV